jgi:hypothetical protein
MLDRKQRLDTQRPKRLGPKRCLLHGEGRFFALKQYLAELLLLLRCHRNGTVVPYGFSRFVVIVPIELAKFLP